MRLMRIEDSSVQTAMFNLIKHFRYFRTLFVSGKFINGSWYHDENTPIYENMEWLDGNPMIRLFDFILLLVIK